MDITAIKIAINGVDRIPLDAANALAPAQKIDDKPYVIIRARSAGVFAGYLAERDPQNREARIINARRLWRWSGAASLSQLAVDGVSKPKDCKFPTEVAEITVAEVIEIIPCTEKARLSIKGVAVWSE